MSTSFSSLPVIDVGALQDATLSCSAEQSLSQQLYDAFATTGFAYLINAPLSFDHEELFSLAKDFFDMPLEQKSSVAKKSFKPENINTYRGYFPTQPDLVPDNLKEGFEIGPPNPRAPQLQSRSQKINLSEPNIWPSPEHFPSKSRARLEQIHQELQSLSSTLLSLLALSLGKPRDNFITWLEDSLSTLRLLHYPAVRNRVLASEPKQNPDAPAHVKLSCTPHTDSGILTLLHQDSTGGLEVLNSTGSWIPAPYIPGSIVVNIGDLMEKVSGGRWRATMHRVKAPGQGGRCSVPFFFEPGEGCRIRTYGKGGEGMEGEKDGEVVYGDWVRGKMSTWVEFWDGEEGEG